jgi:hypothetical protein
VNLLPRFAEASKRTPDVEGVCFDFPIPSGIRSLPLRVKIRYKVGQKWTIVVARVKKPTAGSGFHLGLKNQTSETALFMKK